MFLRRYSASAVGQGAAVLQKSSAQDPNALTTNYLTSFTFGEHRDSLQLRGISLGRRSAQRNRRWTGGALDVSSVCESMESTPTASGCRLWSTRRLLFDLVRLVVLTPLLEAWLSVARSWRFHARVYLVVALPDVYCRCASGSEQSCSLCLCAFFLAPCVKGRVQTKALCLITAVEFGRGWVCA
jgi:hypothetical protein